MWIDYGGDDKQQVIRALQHYDTEWGISYIPPNIMLRIVHLIKSFIIKQGLLFQVPGRLRVRKKNTGRILQKDFGTIHRNYCKPYGWFNFLPSDLFVKHILTLSNIGEMLQMFISVWTKKETQSENQLIKSAVSSMSNLKIFTMRKISHKVIERDEAWCHCTCQRCKKSCFVKNTGLDPIAIFIMKLIISVWYQHVYALKPDEIMSGTRHFPSGISVPKEMKDT